MIIFTIKKAPFKKDCIVFRTSAYRDGDVAAARVRPGVGVEQRHVPAALAPEERNGPFLLSFL